MAYKVFISHSLKDSDLVQDLARRLRQTGVVAVPGTSLRGATRAKAGEDFAAEKRIVTQVEPELRRSDEVIVLLTDHSVNSPRVMSEAGVAFGLHKRVTPVLIGSPEMPSVLQSIKSIKYSELSKYLSGLRRRAQPAKKVKRASGNSTRGA
jgi:hypothetical protein